MPECSIRQWKPITGFPLIIEASEVGEKITIDIVDELENDVEGNSWSSCCEKATINLDGNPLFITMEAN